MSDTFDTIKVEPERDRYGRYLIHPAKGGKPKAYTRATTVAETLDDRFNLEQWKVRTTALGMVQRPDLYAAIASTPPDEKGKLNKLCDQAREAAAGSAGANLGTALHRFTERINRGEEVRVPAPWDADIAAYTTTLKDRSITMDRRFIERIVVLEALGIAGMFDLLTWDESNGHTAHGPYITDLKTGATLDFSWCAIAVQLAIYSRADTIYDPATKTHEAMPLGVDQDKALVIHLPAGKATCTLYEVDIAAGWEAAQHALWTRNWRKRKNLAVPATQVVSGGESVRLSVQVSGAPTDTLGGGDDLNPPAAVNVTPVVDVGGGEMTPPTPSGHTSTPAGTERDYKREAMTALAPLVVHEIEKEKSQRRQALVERVKNLRPEWLEEMAAKWPVGVPTFKQTPHHTDEQLDAIEKVLDGIDWGGDPLPVPDVPVEPEPELPPAARWVAPDEGADLTTAEYETAQAWFAGQSADVQSIVQQWAAEAHAAMRFMSLRQKASRRRWTILMAACLAADRIGDIEVVRAVVGWVAELEMQEAFTTGAALGSLTIEQARRLAAFAEHFGTDIELIYTADGPTFRGDGLAAIAA